MRKILFWIVPLIVILGCGSPGGGGGGVQTVVDVISINYSGTGHSVAGYTHNGEAQTELTVNLTDLATSDVLLVFTNTGESFQILPPGSGSGIEASASFSQIEKSVASASQQAPRTPAAIREFNANPPTLSAFLPKGSTIGPPPGPLFFTVGDTKSWIIFDPAGPNGQGWEDTTLRAQKLDMYDSGKTLNVWVADAMWLAGTINATNLPPIVDKYYHSSQPSVYPMARQIVGAEWGSHAFFGQLISEATDEIHIVIYDIEPFVGPWGIIGYFWAVNNYTNSYLDSQGIAENSNQALVFFMDAPTYVASGGETVFFGTLAHEFQHMIHFYQKFVRRGASSETWLNEMSSMLLEDLLAVYVAGSGFGPATRNGDRLYDYTESPDDSLIDWSGSTDDYASAFAFGGFMIRHYGTDAGATFTRNLVQSSLSGLGAVDNALLLAGAGINADEALRRWGATMAIDPNKDVIPPAYGYLDADWVIPGFFVQTGDDLVLEAASMYSFQNPPAGPPTLVTPKRYSVPPGLIPSASNVVWEYQKDVTGNLTIELTLPSYTSLSVVVSPNL